MNNILKVSECIKKSEIDAILITDYYNRLFATGFSSTAGVLFVTGECAWFFTDSRYDEAAGNVILNAEVRLVTKEAPYSKQIGEIIAENNIMKIGFEEDCILYSEYRDWCAKLDAELCPEQRILNDLRAVKSQEELEKLIEIQRISEKAFEEILPMISDKITEKDLADELIYRLLKNGAEDKSFDPIVVSGERSSMPHGVPTNAKIKKGFLTLDFGAKLNGWCSDTTRTVCLGEPSDEMKKVYDTVLEAQLAGIAVARAGVKGSEVDGAARSVIEKAGYGKYFGHGFGHGLGLQVHESPNAAPSWEKPLPAGTVISAEPGIYLPGKFGVRIEDVIYITTGDAINITHLPKKLLIL